MIKTTRVRTFLASNVLIVESRTPEKATDNRNRPTDDIRPTSAIAAARKERPLPPSVTATS